MKKTTIDKQNMLEVIAQLPDETSIEEVIEALYILTQIKQGIEDFETGNYMTTEELLENMKKW